MNRAMNIVPVVLAGMLAVAGSLAQVQQVADSSYDARALKPAYLHAHPRVLFDEAHRNFHTSTGRYRPFAQLITSDGYRVTPNTQPFSATSLEGYELLVIANAGCPGWDSTSGPTASGFSAEEIEAVHAWVDRGGSLLLIADHAPFGTCAENLAKRFGVAMSKGYTMDTLHSDTVSHNPTVLVYSRDNGLLAEHPITRGRDSTERIERVIAFTGQSLSGPPDGIPFMMLSPSARDLPFRSFASPAERDSAMAHATPAGGRAQGVAFTTNKGRVVVLGEAAMLSAQVIKGPDGKVMFKMGMNREGIDNRQLALNIMHWLSHLLN